MFSQVHERPHQGKQNPGKEERVLNTQLKLNLRQLKAQIFGVPTKKTTAKNELV